MNILGISALYHDSAAALVRDGAIIAAAQEERFTRRKHDERLPLHAILHVLESGGVGRDQLDAVVYFDKPLTKLTRLLSTYAAGAPSGISTFLHAIPSWLREKGWVGRSIEQFLKREGWSVPRRFGFAEHHLSHAASAYYPSPFRDAAILTVDGVGEWCCTSIADGDGGHLRPVQEQRFPHSVGLLYSAFTYFTGFKVNSGEYKLMGLAPYGRPVYADRIREHVVHIHEDGSIRLNLDLFDFPTGWTMTNDRFARAFDGPARKPESPITAREMNLAASLQHVTEEILLRQARYARAITGRRNLCLAGGVALNCVANGRILRERIFDDLWIQPAAGDAGGAVGAALLYWHQVLGQARECTPDADGMRGALLGPAFPTASIQAFLDRNGIPYTRLADEARARFLADRLARESVVGLFQGRMEFGPRALGARSILADARSARMQSHLNLATKFRESFRPFAPMVLAEDCAGFFPHVRHSPYMLLVDEVRDSWRLPVPAGVDPANLVEWVNQARSRIPAVTHVDNSARIQTVDAATHPWLHRLLREFKALTGVGMLVNTSFNVRSEPIVCTPEDAFRCFMRTGMDLLVLEDCVLEKERMPEWSEHEHWREEFGLD